MNQTLVIKVGGALLTAQENQNHNGSQSDKDNHSDKDNQSDTTALTRLLDALVALQSHLSVVLVHGGGDTVQSLLEKLDFESHKVDGIRVTPEAQIPYVAGALAGTVNSQLCGAAKTKGLRPVGLTLLDGDMTEATPMEKTFGAVGTVAPANPELIQQLCENGFLPVISSIGCTDDGQLLNINADDAAAVIAQLIGADLILLSDVPGVLDGNKQLIPELNHQQIQDYCSQNIIQGGMVVKVKSALETAIATKRSVYITSWKSPDSLLAFVAGKTGNAMHQVICGTRIYSDDSKADISQAESSQVKNAQPNETQSHHYQTQTQTQNHHS